MTDHLVIVSIGGDRFLGLTVEEFKAALERGRELVAEGATPSGANGDAPRLHTAEQMQTQTSVPRGWFLEQARLGQIPHHTFGKYKRFDLHEVIACSRFQERG